MFHSSGEGCLSRPRQLKLFSWWVYNLPFLFHQEGPVNVVGAIWFLGYPGLIPWRALKVITYTLNWTGSNLALNAAQVVTCTILGMARIVCTTTFCISHSFQILFKVAACRVHWCSSYRRRVGHERRAPLSRKNHNRCTTQNWAKALLGMPATCSLRSHESREICRLCTRAVWDGATPWKSRKGKIPGYRRASRPQLLCLPMAQLKPFVLHPDIHSLQALWKRIHSITLSSGMGMYNWDRWAHPAGLCRCKGEDRARIRTGAKAHTTN